MKAYISGDFNLNLIRYSTNESVRNFADTMFNNYFFPCTHKVTRVAGLSATLIDSIWTNDITSHKTNGILMSDSSDHFAPFIIFYSLIRTGPSTSTTITYRDLKHSSEEDIRNSLTSFLSNFQINDDVNSDFNRISLILAQVSQSSFPIKTKILKNKSILKPWFTNDLKEIVDEKNKLQKKYIRRPTTYGNEYRRHRNFVNNKIKDTKANFYKNKLNETIGNSKKTWQVISQILNSKSNRDQYIKKLKVNNKVIDDANEISDEFNKYFTEIGKKLASKMRIARTRPESYLRGIYPHVETFHHTDVSEVKKVILKLKKL